MKAIVIRLPFCNQIHAEISVQLNLPQLTPNPTHGGIMKLGTFILSIILSFSAVAADEPTPIAGNIGHDLKIIDLIDAKVIDQHINQLDFYESYMIVELSGHFEGHYRGSANDEIYASLDIQTPAQGSYSPYTFALHPSFKTAGPLVIGGGAITAVSVPKEFRKQIKITTYQIDWLTCGGMCKHLTWNVTAAKKGSGQTDDKRLVEGVIRSGFEATLNNWDESRRKWEFSKVNFPK